MGVLCVLAAVGAAPDAIRVIATPEAEAAGARVREHLALDPRLIVAGGVVIAAPMPRERPDFEALAALADRAREEYEGLNPEAALSTVTELRNALLLHLDLPEAVDLLARGVRVAGLAHLFLQHGAEGSSAFASAALLDPDFSPTRDQWPPEARLAYADAIAALRRSPPGVLTIRVEPEVASLWLDGRPAGAGRTTLSELPPGHHFLLARCAGFEPVAAVVEIAGDGRLDEASLFLEPKGEPRARAEQLAAVVEAAERGGDNEAAMVAFVVAREVAGALVLVRQDSMTLQPQVLVFGADGARRGPPIALTDGEAALQRVTAEVLGEPLVDAQPTTTEPPPPAIAWYERWPVWVAIGAAVVAGGVTATYFAAQQSDTVTLFGGRRPQ